jgi:hypothetical protein
MILIRTTMKAYVNPYRNNDMILTFMTLVLIIWFDICALSRLSISDDGETAVLRVRPHHSRNVSHIPAGNPFNPFTAFSNRWTPSRVFLFCTFSKTPCHCLLGICSSITVFFLFQLKQLYLSNPYFKFFYKIRSFFRGEKWMPVNPSN